MNKNDSIDDHDEPHVLLSYSYIVLRTVISMFLNFPSRILDINVHLYQYTGSEDTIYS
jgi:hypothetical protein